MFRNFRVDLVNSNTKKLNQASLRKSRGTQSAVELMNTSPPVKMVSSKQELELFQNGLPKQSYFNQDESELSLFMEMKSTEGYLYLPLNPKNRHNECLVEKRKFLQAAQSYNCSEHKRIERKTSNSKKRKEEDYLDLQIQLAELFFNDPYGANISIIKTEISRKQQLKRDSILQEQFLGVKSSARHMSKVMLRNIHLLVTHLTMQDSFKINISEAEFDQFLRKQPSLLKKEISSKDIVNADKWFIDNDLLLARKQYLVNQAFNDKRFDVKDREVIFKVILYHLEQALKQQERLDRIGIGLGGLKILKQNIKIEQLNKIILYVGSNYAQLVKRIDN